ncbi:VOC family protein [Streptomyces sporangiiformans]|nr:VOC family protein [Streptomyces sporangiiformans]
MTRPLEAGVVVRDLELMERFYREALGCVPVHRSGIPRSISGPAGLGGLLLVVWLQVPSGMPSGMASQAASEVPSGGRIKLIRPQADVMPASPALPPEPLTARRGLAYLTFHLDDIAPVVAALPAAGARPLSSPVVVRARNRRISFWADPEGNVVELVDQRGGDRETDEPG